MILMRIVLNLLQIIIVADKKQLKFKCGIPAAPMPVLRALALKPWIILENLLAGREGRVL